MAGGHRSITHDVMITSLSRQNVHITSFWRNNDVVITSCVCWASIFEKIDCYIESISYIKMMHNKSDIVRHVVSVLIHVYCIYASPRPSWQRHWTPWSQDKMAVILQTFSNSFSCMQVVVFWFKFHLNLFTNVQLWITQHLLSQQPNFRAIGNL